MSTTESMTLVTALYDLGAREPGINRRDTDHYLEAARPLLDLDADLVIFGDPAPVERLLEGRRSRGLAARTEAVPGPLEECDAHRELDRIAAARRELPLLNGNPDKDTPLYTTLVWTKFELVSRAIRAGLVRSSHCGWIDVGLPALGAGPVEALSVCPDSIRLLMLRPFAAAELDDPAVYYSALHGIVAAGYMPGPTESWLQLSELFASASRRLLDDGLAASDEQLLPALYLERPELFEFHHGDYEAILLNFDRPRGSPSNLLMQLRKAREIEDWARGWSLAAPLFESIRAGCFDGDATVRAELLDECFLCAFYGADPDRRPAREIVSLYEKQVREEPAFRAVFLRNEIRVRENFELVRTGPADTTRGE